MRQHYLKLFLIPIIIGLSGCSQTNTVPQVTFSTNISTPSPSTISPPLSAASSTIIISPDKKGWHRFINYSFNYQFDYPPDWRIITEGMETR